MTSHRQNFRPLKTSAWQLVKDTDILHASLYAMCLLRKRILARPEQLENLEELLDEVYLISSVDDPWNGRATAVRVAVKCFLSLDGNEGYYSRFRHHWAIKRRYRRFADAVLERAWKLFVLSHPIRWEAAHRVDSKKYTGDYASLEQEHLDHADATFWECRRFLSDCSASLTELTPNLSAYELQQLADLFSRYVTVEQYAVEKPFVSEWKKVADLSREDDVHIGYGWIRETTTGEEWVAEAYGCRMESFDRVNWVQFRSLISDVNAVKRALRNPA